MNHQKNKFNKNALPSTLTHRKEIYHSNTYVHMYIYIVCVYIYAYIDNCFVLHYLLYIFIPFKHTFYSSELLHRFRNIYWFQRNSVISSHTPLVKVYSWCQRMGTSLSIQLFKWPVLYSIIHSVSKFLITLIYFE